MTNLLDAKGVQSVSDRIRRLINRLLTPTPPIWWPEHFDTDECAHSDPSDCGYCRFAESI